MKAKISEAAKTRSPDKHSHWKGGVAAGVGGRRRIYVGRDHPMAQSKGYVLEHRLVMAGVLGRFLLPEENVHHINGDHGDNRSENLLVVTRSEHMQIHNLVRNGMACELATAHVIPSFHTA